MEAKAATPPALEAVGTASHNNQGTSAAASEQTGNHASPSGATSTASISTIDSEAAKISVISSDFDKIIALRYENGVPVERIPGVEAWEDEVGRFRMFQRSWNTFSGKDPTLDDQAEGRIFLDAIAVSLDSIRSNLEEGKPGDYVKFGTAC